jgi:hypothetical protein
MKKTGILFLSLLPSLLIAGALLTPGRAQEPRQTPGRIQASPSGLGFPDLVGGLKSTPGCLGVETAQTPGGKQVLFAWFENKKAALAWYYSAMHQGAMKKFFPGSGTGAPMKDIKDDGRPILTIASVTPAPKGSVSGTSLPISQIAIELYSPSPGGVAYGGRFAPASLKVPGLRDMTSTSH